MLGGDRSRGDDPVGLHPLKDLPLAEPSSSKGTMSRPFPFSRGAGVRLVATASGTAARGRGELGVWREWGELGVWAVCGVGDGGRVDSAVGMLEAPAFADVALGRALKALASAIRLDESITDAAPEKQKIKRLELILVKGTCSTYKHLEQTNSTNNNKRKHIKRYI